MRYLSNTLALTLGLLFGGTVILPAMAAVRSVPVTWPTAGCPVGIFPVVVTANAIGDTGDVRLFSGTVDTSLPTFTYPLTGLYATDYIVSAMTNGQFQSTSQTIRGDGQPPPIATPTPTPTPPPPPVQQLASVALSKNPVNEGETVQATAKDATGNPIIGVVWSVEHSFMASIDQTGLITNIALTGPVAGRPSANTGIIATLNGVTASTQLTVNAGPVPTPTPTPTPTPVATLDSIAAQVTALDGKVTSHDAFIRSTLSTFQSAMNASFTQVITLVTNLPSLAQIQSVVASELQKALAPVIQTPPTCPVTIISVLSPYANGDWRFTVRATPCLAAPVKGSVLQVIK